MKKTIGKGAVFFSFAILITSLCHAIYPFVLSEPPHFAETWRRMQAWFSARGFESIPSQKSMVSVYRFDVERTGRHLFEGNPLKMRVVFKKEGLMNGIHTASKATPAVDESGVYFGSDTGVFYKFNHEGELLWRFRTEGGSQGIHGSALVTETAVYFGNYAGQFYCLNKMNGNLIWVTEVANAVGSSPFLWDGKVIFSAEFSVPHEGFEVALDASTGERVWSSPFFGEQVHASPTLAPDLGIIGVGNNAGQFLGISLKDGSILWWTNEELPVKDTAFYFDHQFCFSGWNKKFRCVEAATGKEVFSVDLDGKSMSSPAVDIKTKTAYVLSASGYVFAIDLKNRYIKNKYLLGDLNNIGRLNMFSPVLLSTKKGDFLITTCFKIQLCIFDPELHLRAKVDVGGIVSGSLGVWKDQIFAVLDDIGLVKIK